MGGTCWLWQMRGGSRGCHRTGPAELEGPKGAREPWAGWLWALPGTARHFHALGWAHGASVLSQALQERGLLLSPVFQGSGMCPSHPLPLALLGTSQGATVSHLH